MAKSQSQEHSLPRIISMHLHTPKKHPSRTLFHSGRLRQTSVSLKNGCAHCRWAGNFAVIAKNKPFLLPSSQRVAFESCAGAGLSLRSSKQHSFLVSWALWLLIPIKWRKLRRRIRPKLLALLLRVWESIVSATKKLHQKSIILKNSCDWCNLLW